MIFEQLEKRDYEQLIFCQDRHSGLKAIIAIHDTTLGPALGGARMWPYENEREAIIDALRLARGMTYKAAASGLNLGGGKAVIIGDPNKDKSEALFRAFGRYIQGLNGRYITARDVGTNESDMDAIYQETRFVTGVRGAGNPSPATAYGVYRGMKAAALTAFGSDELRGKTIAVQGVGEVAFHLCEYLHKEGANLIVADISADQVERAVAKYGAKKVGVDEIYEVDCDIFSPCALGGVLNDRTIPRLKAKAIAGSANNQLLENRHGDMLAERGVVYAPDYVINAGGLMNAADELIGYQRERAMKKVETIYDNVLRVFEISERDGVPSHVAADRLAEERIESMKRSRNAFLLNERHMLNRNDD